MEIESGALSKVADQQEQSDDPDEDEYYQKFKEALLKNKAGPSAEADGARFAEDDRLNVSSEQRAPAGKRVSVAEAGASKPANDDGFLSDEPNEQLERTIIQSQQEQMDYFSNVKKQSDRKQLKPIDHLQQHYKPFKKNFYIESSEITAMTEEEVAQYRKELGDIAVRGENVNRPIKTWFQCGLNNVIIHILKEKKKYAQPFAIQC